MRQIKRLAAEIYAKMLNDADTAHLTNREFKLQCFCLAATNVGIITPDEMEEYFDTVGPLKLR